jgi:hypothetical protein
MAKGRTGSRSCPWSRPAARGVILGVMDANRDGLLADPPDQLRAYIRNGRITALPAKRTRRLLLLDRVAQAFEPGRRYPEPTVNDILKAVFDDHCALRRYLVDEEFLSRTAAGTYWRVGGTVDA